jgi:oxygen-dependent protoporphyrinogen oxidase
MSHVIVVGGGITGLAAAYEAATDGARVTVLEAAPHPGGKVRTSPFAGLPIDEGADAFLARVPDGVALCRELGIEGDLVSPAARRAYVYSRGELRLLPREQLLGVPSDLDAVAASGIVSAEAIEIARQDLTAPGTPPERDETVGAFIRRRLGNEILERLVDPLVGSINAGNTDELSLAATVPQLDLAARGEERSLIRTCRALRDAADLDAPVFFAPREGMVDLVRHLLDALSRLGTDVRTDTDVIALTEGGRGVKTEAGEELSADGIIVTTPPPVAADQVVGVSPRVSALLGEIPMASVTLVTLAVERGDVDHELDASGFLVARPEQLLLTACSWTSSKWAHLHGDGSTVVLRASVGRHGDARAETMDDDTLVPAVLDDLRTTMGLHGEPLETRISRWPASFPQYRSGHLGWLVAIEDELATRAPTVIVTGAGFRGLGVPACIRQGRQAARSLLARLG